MTNTFKSLLFSLLITGLSFTASAQRSFPDSVRIGAGIEAGLVNGTFGEQYKTVFGGSVRVDYPVLHKLYVTANVGLNLMNPAGSYKGNQAIAGVSTAVLKTIPVKLGVKYILFDGFYAQGEVGQTLLTNRKEAYAIYSRSLTFAPQFGMLFPIRNNKAFIDAGIRYEQVSSFYNTKEGFNFWGAHVTYSFKL